MELRVRPALASVFAVVAAIMATVAPFYQQPFCYVVPGILAASALLVHRRAFALQLLARGIWASTFTYAAIVLINWVFFLGHWRFNNHFIVVQAMLALASGGALFVMGGAGFEPEGACPFRPIAFRRTLLALMVMATAIALECAISCVVWLAQGFTETGTFAFGALYALTAFGIYRLRVWGLLLNLLAAVFMLRIAPSGPSVGLAFGWSLVPLSQIALMVPIAVAIVRAQRSKTIGEIVCETEPRPPRFAPSSSNSRLRLASAPVRSAKPRIRGSGRNMKRRCSRSSETANDDAGSDDGTSGAKAPKLTSGH